MNNRVNDDRRRLQLDGNKMLKHLDSVEDWLSGKGIYPIYVAFSPSSMCNHKCQFCVYHYKKFEPLYFPYEKYVRLVEELSFLGIKSMFFAGDGEPLLNKHTPKMLEVTKSKGIDVALNTNGRLLFKNTNEIVVKNLEWIRISLNAGTRETYALVHGTAANDFDIVMENIKNLVAQKEKYGSNITIGVQCVLLEENHHEIESLALSLRDIGVDYLSVKPFLKHPDIQYSTEIKNKDKVLKNLLTLSKLSTDKFQFVMRENNFGVASERTYKRCLSGQFMIEIDAVGDVYTCGPYIGNKDHCYGNIIEQSFFEMWNSEQCKEVLSYVQNKLCVSTCMPFCRPDSVNKFLWEIRNPPDHVNFI